MNIVKVATKINIAKFSQNIQFSYLTEEEMNRLIYSYQSHMEKAKNQRNRYKQRWRQFIIFLTAKETGARIGEILLIRDDTDIDFRDNSIRIKTLKQKKDKVRTVFISDKLIAEISRFLMEYPELRGKLFQISKRTVQKYFSDMCKKANIPPEKSHIHILRHTRAIELIKHNVPLHHVKALLGHSSILTTSVYLNVYQKELKEILQERNLL